jgi:hypothetical protein
MTESKIDNKRANSRMPVTLTVEVTHESIGTVELKTRDMSNGGIFVFIDKDPGLNVGLEVLVKVKGQLGDGEEPPTLKMEVVRAEQQGLGLKFLDI